MNKATRARQKAHRTRRDNELRKHAGKQAVHIRHFDEMHRPRRGSFNPFAGPQMSMAAAEALFPRMFR